MLSFSSIMIFEISHYSYKNDNINEEYDNFIKKDSPILTNWRKW